LSKLSVFNGALRVLGERRLASLTENVPARHELDAVWDDGFVKDTLEHGYWNFAMRTQQMDYRTDVEPDFGYQRAFLKPDDWVRTAGISTDEFFTSPLTQYVDEQGYWFCEYDEIYVMYVSSDTSYGADTGLWPESFKRFAEAYLAFRTAPNIAPAELDKAFKIYKKNLAYSRSRDAMNEPSKRMPSGDWVRSRRGSSRGDRGNPHQLIG